MSLGVELTSCHSTVLEVALKAWFPNATSLLLKHALALPQFLTPRSMCSRTKIDFG
jgi:hypothetical protein